MSKFRLVALPIIAALALVRFARRQRPAAAAAPVGSAEADAQTLLALRNAGADLTKPTEVRFYLYFRTREVAERAANSAQTPDLTANVDEGADRKSWLCLVSGRMVPSESAIRAASTRLQALAATLGGEYDGWEAAVTR